MHDAIEPLRTKAVLKNLADINIRRSQCSGLSVAALN